MPDLGHLSLSASLAVNRRPSVKLTTDPLDPTTTTYLCSGSDKTLTSDCNWRLGTSVCEKAEVSNGNEIKVSRRRRGTSDRAKKASEGKALDEYVRDWVRKKMESGVSESRCSLPFLIGAPKMEECLVCHRIIFPGEEVICSVRGCQGVYHTICAKERLGFSNVKKFKCPQHACFICNQKLHWRCRLCTIASHDKCAPWADEVIYKENQWAICWRHPTDWRLDRKHAASTNDLEEIFCRLPLPYADEEFKFDLSWKDVENKMEPPPYKPIRRNIYLVKKKRDGVGYGIGCTNCSSLCCKDCVCRVQCISCSKACLCSETCTNRPFRKDKIKKVKVVKTALCGWGVVATELIKEGDFIIEYIGEVIDDALCEQRLWDMKYNGMKNFYMCEIGKDFTIDATFKGNVSRFLNHSCNPNCVLEKWQVEGETRIGVFAAKSIEIGDPLTYDYRFVQFGPEVECHCGASNCHGYLGTKRRINKVDICWGAKRKRTSTGCIAVITVNKYQQFVQSNNRLDELPL